MDMLVATYQPQGYTSYNIAIDNPVRVYCSNKGNPMVEEMQENGDLFGNVDDLLDFSNDDAIGGSSETFHDNSSHSTLTNMALFCNSSSSSYPTTSNNSKQASSSAQLPNVFDSDELCIPCEEMAELEWLSNFVEESFSSIHEYEGSPFPCNGNSTKADGDQHQQSADVKSELANIKVDRREEALQGSDHHSTVAPLKAVNKDGVVESSFSESEHQLRLMGCGTTNPQLIVGQFYSGGAANTIRSKRCVRTGGAFSHAAVCFWNTKILSTEASESILETSNVSSTTSTSTNIPFPDSTETYNYHHYDILEKIQQSAKKKKRKQPTSTSKLSINYGKSMGLGGHYGSSSSCYGGLSNSKSKVIKKKKVQVVKHVSIIKEEKSMEEGWMSTDDDQAGGAMNESSNGGRRCLHCGSQKTPQWRAGPKGPKTLCNACGVRYKSGRLFPEYRPAASPTFVETLHSNSHRRVLEMRKLRAAAGDLSSSTSTHNDDSNNYHHSNYSNSNNNININIHNHGSAIDYDDDDDDHPHHPHEHHHQHHHHHPPPSKPPPTPTPNNINITTSPHNIIRHGHHSFFAQ